MYRYGTEFVGFDSILRRDFVDFGEQSHLFVGIFAAVVVERFEGNHIVGSSGGNYRPGGESRHEATP